MPSELAEFRLEIIRAISGLREEVVDRIHGLELNMESLTNTQQGWQQSAQRQMSDMERRIGGNEGAIRGVMDYTEKASKKAQLSENELRSSMTLVEQRVRDELLRLEKKVETEHAREQGFDQGLDSFKKSISWIIGVAVGVFTLVSAAVTFFVAQMGAGTP